jgi:hypothetical protein
MRIVALPQLLLVLAATVAGAQTTTYTTTADGCGAKNLGYCRLNVTDQLNHPFVAVLDARYNSQGPINTLQIYTPDNTYPPLLSVHGVYLGFVPNPNGTRQAYYGAGSFLSDDSTVEGTFQFYAYYISTCSGRACAGTMVGWHYRVLIGSTITQQ